MSLSVFSFFEPITEIIRSKAASVLTFCPPDRIFVVMLMIFLVVCTATAMVLQIFMQEALVMHKISMFSYFQINSKTSLFFKSFFIIFFPFTTRDKIVSINYSNKIKNFDTNVLCKSENRKKKSQKCEITIKYHVHRFSIVLKNESCRNITNLNRTSISIKHKMLRKLINVPKMLSYNQTTALHGV